MQWRNHWIQWLLAGDSYIFKSSCICLLWWAHSPPMAGRDWISWLAGRIMECILQKHQKEQICFISHFEKKSCAEQYMKTTINLLPNILACLLCLFWTCVVSPGCWIWPWFCSLACPIYWLCHCGNTNNLPLCHNVASSIPLSCPFKTLLLMSSTLSSNCFCYSLLEYRQQKLVENIS